VELNRGEGSAPLYRQIAAHFEDEIKGQRIARGARLPSEPDLVAELGVSRATATRAMDELARLGFAVRQQGRGTFAAATLLEHGLTELTSFTEITKNAGRRAGQRLVSYQEVEARGTGKDVDAPYSKGTPLALIERVRLIDDEVVGLHRAAVPLLLARRAGLTESRLRRSNPSLYAGLTSQGHAPMFADEWLTADVSDAETGALLGCGPATPLMCVRRESRDAEGNLVEVVDATYLGSIYRYHVALPSGQAHKKLGGNRETEPHSLGTGMQFVGVGGVRR
jgi:GntR family transcriptional regulator